MTLDDLRTKKGQLFSQASEILKLTAAESREMNGEEGQKFDALHADIDKLTISITRLEKQDAAERSLDARGERRVDKPQPQTEHRSKGGPMGGKVTEYERAESVRAWLMAAAQGFEPSADTREMARRCGVNLDSNRMTIRLGPPLKATMPDTNGLRASAEDLRTWHLRVDEERAALTGLQSTTTTGGYTTADETMGALEVALLAYGGMRSVATVIRTATGGPLPIPTTNDTANKGEIIGENLTSNELEMTFGQLVLDAWKYSSKYILASVEFLQDTSINAAEFLGSALGTRIARITNDHFTTGTGSQPNGIVTAATSSAITTASNSVVSYDNLVDVLHTVDPAYRTGGRWMMPDSMLKLLKKVKALQYSGDTTGMPLWAPGLAAGQPDTILGYPYVINQSMAAIGAGTKSLLFGDLSKYIIRDVRDVTVMRLDERFAELGQVAFLALSRHDGDLLNAGTNPVKYMTQGA